MGRQGSRQRSNDPEGVRRRVVDAAYEAFVTEGYHATSVHDVKRRAGATGGALAHHFATKKDLGLAVIRDRVAQAVEDTWIVPVFAAPTAADGIRVVFDGIVAELDARGTVSGCPLNNIAVELARHDEDFRVETDAVFGRWRAALSRKLRDDAGAGRLPGLDPDAFATLVVAAYSGAMAMAKAGQTTEPLKVCARQLAAIMAFRSPAQG